MRFDLKKRAIRGGGSTVFSRATVFFLHTITTMILARILAPEEFGLFVMVTAVVGFLTIFIDLGLTDAIIQKTEIDHSQISTLFWINVAIALSIIVLIIFAAPLIARFYSEPRLIKIAIVWSSFLFWGALSTQHIALLKRRMLFFRIGMIEIAAVFFSNLVAIMIALNGGSYWALVFRQISLTAFTAVGAWLLCKWRPGLPARHAGIRPMLLFGRNATGTFILAYFSGNLDKMLIGSTYGARPLGFYDKAYSLFMMPASQLTEALKNVATSTLSKLRGDPPSFVNYYLKAVSILSLIGMPISFYLVLEGRDVILILLGPQWEQTVAIFRILAASTGIWMIYSTKYWIHASLGRSDRLIRWGVIDFAVFAIAIVSGLRYGPLGIAIAYTIALCLLAGFGLWYAGIPIGLKFYKIVSITWKNFLAAIVSGMLLWSFVQAFGLEWSRLLRLSISFTLYLVSYATFVLVFHRNLQPFTDIVNLIKELFPTPLSDNSKSI